MRATKAVGSEEWSEHVALVFARLDERQRRWVGALLAHEYGSDSFCWASDYPHADGIFPDSQSFIRDTMAHLDENLRQKLIFSNAARLYNLDWLL